MRFHPIPISAPTSVKPQLDRCSLPSAQLKNGLGFTLVELLVVIAILALLISISIPSMSRARENARVTVCASNLKSIGVALYLYADDTDDLLPPLVVQSGDPWPTWDRELLPYLDDDPIIFRCPSDPLVVKGSQSNRTYAANGGVSNVGRASRYPFGNATTSPHSLSKLTGDATRLILLGERPGDTTSARGYVGRAEFGSMDQIPSTVHRQGEGGNYLWSDLSASYATTSDVILTATNDVWYIAN